MIEYDVPRICLNGHLVGFDFVSPIRPGLNQKADPFCERCGQPAIVQCPACNSEITRHTLTLASDAHRAHEVPSFCRRCGKPYPWTERRLQAARELIDLEQTLAPDEKAALKTDIQDIAHDAPRTRAASIRIKNALATVSGALGSALRDIIVNVASEAAKKTILGP